MKRTAMSLMLIASLFGTPVLVGCDRTVSEDKTVKTNSDGSTDIAVFRPSEGGWYVKGQPPFPQIWGQSGDVPVPADYNGDGTADTGLYAWSKGRLSLVARTGTIIPGVGTVASLVMGTIVIP